MIAIPPLSAMDKISEEMRRLYALAVDVPDPRTQNAASVLTVEGDVFRAVNLPLITATLSELTDREHKLMITEHAERHVLFKALRAQQRPYIMVCPWAACADCARSIVLSGVKFLFRHSQAMADIEESPWKDSIAMGDRIMAAYGVEVIDVDMPYYGGAPIRRGGELFYP